ncbi:type II toxin-antitoxin system antitoxin SocA domain-containing protein [Neobacillus vireti]|uniref:Panacea domain-containing protein n=1 Tax=Neobacillus vireti TaxID=220686 RepID=UPI002FFEEA7D
MAKIYEFKGRGIELPQTLQVAKVDVKDVAKAFLTIAPMTHKKLQKLSYYAYSWYYTLYGEKLFNNHFQAWVHGPVSPELYQEYKRFGWREIDMVDELPGDFEQEPELISFIHEVYDSYGHLNGDQLEYLTHIEEPWKEARGNLGDLDPCTNVIKDETILRYYQKVLENEQQE